MEMELEDGDFQIDLKNKKADIVTNSILEVLIDEIMNDDFTLRELIKLDPNCVATPKGIKTNMNAIKVY